MDSESLDFVGQRGSKGASSTRQSRAGSHAQAVTRRQSRLLKEAVPGEHNKSGKHGPKYSRHLHDKRNLD